MRSNFLFRPTALFPIFGRLRFWDAFVSFTAETTEGDGVRVFRHLCELQSEAVTFIGIKLSRGSYDPVTMLRKREIPPASGKGFVGGGFNIVPLDSGESGERSRTHGWSVLIFQLYLQRRAFADEKWFLCKGRLDGRSMAIAGVIPVHAASIRMTTRFNQICFKFRNVLRKKFFVGHNVLQYQHYAIAL